MSGWSRQKRIQFESAFMDFLCEARVFSKDHGQIVLGEKLYRAQKMFFTSVFDGLEEDVHTFDCLKSRQLGVSTSTRALTVFWVGMHDGLASACVFDTDNNRANARREVTTMIRALPESLGFPKIRSDNRHSITLENDSTVTFMSAGVRKGKGTDSLGASLGLTCAHLSELCKYGDEAGLESFRHSLSKIHPNRLFIKESTARGYNLWHDIWTEDSEDPSVRQVFLGWWSKDSQIIKRSEPDYEKYGVFPPTENEVKKIALVEKLYGWKITDEQLAWIRRDSDPAAKVEGDAPPEFTPSVVRLQEQPWCVTRETRVGTARGILKIEDVRAGDVTSQGIATHAGPTGSSVVWRATTALGYTLRGTGNHPLIDHLGHEVRLDSSLGTTVQLQPPMFAEAQHVIRWKEGVFDISVPVTEDLARFVGLFMGDGSAHEGRGKHGAVREVKICCDAKDDDVVQECMRLFVSLFGSGSLHRPRPGWCDVRSGTKLVFDTIKKLGLTRNDTGRTMRRVHVPEFIWLSPKPVVRAFLSGLFEADGHSAKATNRVSIFSKYPSFLKDVQLILLSFGITSKFVTQNKKTGDHEYTGNALELRSSEAIRFHNEIGFLSERKRGTYKQWTVNRAQKPIYLSDKVVSVVNEGVVEEVFNLTVEGSHLFDANGILTHNTEEDSWQQAGSIFFNPENLKVQADKYCSNKFQAFMFGTGMEFVDMRVYKPPNQKMIELKVWEEPQEECVYVVACDPAFGSHEDNDRSCIQVLRCYADGCDQVAEYAWPLISTRQLAWVVLAMAGWYAGTSSEVYLIVELNGPGAAVWDEIVSTRQQIMTGGYRREETEARGLARVLGNIRNYIYTRSDAMTSGKAWMWKTAPGTGPTGKVRVMERLRDFVDNSMLRIRSMATLEEMRSVSREGDSIAAGGRNKDDRVMGLGLAIRCWEERVRRMMTAAMRTRDREHAKQRLTPEDKYKMFNTFQFQAFMKGQEQVRARQARVLRQAQLKARGYRR